MWKCRMWTKKPLARNENLIQTKKLGLEWAVKGLGKHLQKNPFQKIEKTVKIRVKLPHVNKKPPTEKPNFCSNTIFALYCKIRAKKIHAAKPLAFSLHFLFRRDQNHYSNLTSKIKKMCEQILKKTKPEEFRKRLEVKIHSNSIPLLIKQNVPSIIYYYL